MRARFATSGTVVAAAALALAGCTFVTPQATMKQYDPSDGVSATVGDVKVVNVLAIVGDDDADGPNLVFTGVNLGDEDVTIGIQFEGASGSTDETVDLAVGTTKIGTDEQFVLDGADAQPGGLLPVYFQYGEHEGKQLLVPVLDGEWEEYADLVPTATPTPTPTPTDTAAPSTDGTTEDATTEEQESEG